MTNQSRGLVICICCGDMATCLEGHAMCIGCEKGNHQDYCEAVKDGR